MFLYKLLATTQSEWCVEGVDLDRLLPLHMPTFFRETSLLMCYCPRGGRQLRLSFLRHLLTDIVSVHPDRSEVLRIGSFGSGLLGMEAVLGQALRLLGYERVVLRAADIIYTTKGISREHADIFDRAWSDRFKLVDFNTSINMYNSVHNIFSELLLRKVDIKFLDYFTGILRDHYFYRLFQHAQAALIDESYGFSERYFYSSSDDLFRDCDTLDYWISADVIGLNFRRVLPDSSFYKLFFDDNKDKFLDTRVFLMECLGSFKMAHWVDDDSGLFCFGFVDLNAEALDSE